MTSAISDEGKTTVAVNLAISLAKKGKKVALLDGDLRHPSVALSMEFGQKYGIADVLNKKQISNRLCFATASMS